MFEHPAIPVVGIAVLVALGVGIGARSLRRREKVRNLCAEVAQAIEQRRHGDALRILLAAERSWAFNSHDGSRTSCIADLDDFTRVLFLFARLRSARGDASRITRLESVVAELRALFSDREHFGIDGRSMKKEAGIRWSELSGHFEALRREFRDSYETTKTTT